MDPTLLTSLASRFGLDLVCLFVLLVALRRRRAHVPEMVAVVVALNVGLFAAVAVIGIGDFPTGIGFGLFGLLSLVRLRSAAFTLADVAYTFIALVLALVNGLPDRSLSLIVALDVVLLVALLLAGGGRGSQPIRIVRMTLDRAVTDPADLRRVVAERFASAPLAVADIAVEEIDLVRDTTRIVVRHSVAERWDWRDQQSGEDGAFQSFGDRLA